MFWKRWEWSGLWGTQRPKSGLGYLSGWTEKRVEKRLPRSSSELSKSTLPILWTRLIGLAAAVAAWVPAVLLLVVFVMSISLSPLSLIL